MTIITPHQCRAGRALLDISQDRLAEKSGVSKRTIANFENGHKLPTRVNRTAIKQALEELGVAFFENGSVGLRDGDS